VLNNKRSKDLKDLKKGLGLFFLFVIKNEQIDIQTIFCRKSIKIPFFLLFYRFSAKNPLLDEIFQFGRNHFYERLND